LPSCWLLGGLKNSWRLFMAALACGPDTMRWRAVGGLKRRLWGRSSPATAGAAMAALARGGWTKYRRWGVEIRPAAPVAAGDH